MNLFLKISDFAKKTITGKDISSLFHDLENIPLEIAVYDQSGNVVFMNSHFYTNGQERQVFIGHNDAFYFGKTGLKAKQPGKRREYFDLANRTAQTVHFTEKLFSAQKNKTFYFKRTFQPLSTTSSEKIKYIAFFGSNITAIILSQKELKYLAFHDKLTGLGNRDAFNNQLDQLILEGHRPENRQTAALLFCDLDNFKLVNDSLGHDTGDQLLIQASQRMRTILRRSDQLFRMGGDEFVILLKNLKEEHFASRVAEKILMALSAVYSINEQQVNYITASIGISLFPSDGMDREVLLNKADMAMYEAKKASKNNFKFFSAEMTAEAQKRLAIVKNLREMINQNIYEKQFYMNYQPIVEKFANGDFKIVAAEALLRWTHPQMGSIPPGIFIPIAEESNLIHNFGNWVLEKSLSDYKYLSGKFPDPSFYISVNLSAKQLKSSQLVEMMLAAVKSAEINPNDVQIEVTETSILDENSPAFKNMDKLKELGFRLAIDDFGVGFASLSYLQKIPANVIKIDQSFIKKALSSTKNSELVKAIILLGKNLNKEVIAEGVEKAEHLEFLNANECFKYQGFLFSKPLSLNELENLLQKQKGSYSKRNK